MLRTRYADRWTVSVRRTALVAVGDIVAIAAFLLYGLLIHAVNPLVFPQHTVLAAAPFIFAWVITAPLGGLYRPETVTSVRSALTKTTAVWVVASLAGGAIRGTEYFPGEAPAVFLVVNIVFGLAFLLPWRLAVAYTLGR